MVTPPKPVPSTAAVWPVAAPKPASPPRQEGHTVLTTMLLTTVPALLAVAVLRPGSHTYRRNR
ncbi:hypothetical protein [Actinacidiphila yeochonensis]|uniref:hypothetical protein n=1 Tax=Actinacidiphila yeochonensis TaxID=89050 RepID=UPI0012FECD45|nr:hypothetical protein [Actinacidiphila yeochonensis]